MPPGDDHGRNTMATRPKPMLQADDLEGVAEREEILADRREQGDF